MRSEETSLRVRAPDKRRLFAVEDHTQERRLRHPEDASTASPRTRAPRALLIGFGSPLPHADCTAAFRQPLLYARCRLARNGEIPVAQGSGDGPPDVGSPSP